jgi:hypothetical protein
MAPTTLIIHPRDATTAFLTRVYDGLDYTVCNAPDVSNQELQELMAQHHRIVVMGHGSQQGLFHPVRMVPHLISAEHAHLFHDKETVFLWCYASDFAKQHHIRALCTGMFVSDQAEAMWTGIGAGAFAIQQSNTFFAEAMRTVLQADQLPDIQQVLKLYPPNLNRVAAYNAPKLEWVQ